MELNDLKALVSRLEAGNQLLKDKERELADGQEELMAQKEELTAAIEQLQEKNFALTDALKELKQRNQELDQILYQTSHHLRTPVKSLEGLLNILHDEELLPEQKIVCQHMAEKVQQMEELLTSLTNLSSATFSAVHPAPVGIATLTAEIIGELKTVANYPIIQFDIDVADDLSINTDKPLLKLVLKEIIANAITFRDPSKTATISIKCFRFGSTFQIMVADNGEGIDEGIRERIFELFFRGSERSPGYGLGLYIVKSCLQRLDGKIDFESKPEGTIFRLTLPVL